MKFKKLGALILGAILTVGIAAGVGLNSEGQRVDASSNGNYVKVTSTPSDWSGDYLIVYEADKVAFNGGLTALDAASNTIGITISDNKIAATEATNAAKFTINTSGHIKSASGYYIGQTSNGNGLKSSTSTTYTNTISINSDGTVNLVSAGAYLRYNATSGQYRFRYYKSSSYTNQKAICLYKLEGGTTDPETPVATLSSLSISDELTKTEYYVGDSWDPSGLIVTGTYSDGNTSELTPDEWNFSPATPTLGTTSVAIKAKIGEIESEPVSFDVTVKELEKYELVTNVNSLKEGLKIVLVGEYEGKSYALSTNQKDSNRGATSELTFDDNNNLQLTNDTQIFTLEKGTDDGTYAFNTGSGYIYAASSSANQLKTQDTYDANGSWKILIDNENLATITAAGTNSRNELRFNYNNNSPLFSCYAAGTSTGVSVKIYSEPIEKVYPTSISVEDLNVPQGGEGDLLITTQPIDAVMDEITFACDDEFISVDENGHVSVLDDTLVGHSTNVTVSTKNANNETISDTCTITVVDPTVTEVLFNLYTEYFNGQKICEFEGGKIFAKTTNGQIDLSLDEVEIHLGDEIVDPNYQLTSEDNGKNIQFIYEGVASSAREIKVTERFAFITFTPQLPGGNDYMTIGSTAQIPFSYASYDDKGVATVSSTNSDLIEAEVGDISKDGRTYSGTITLNAPSENTIEGQVEIKLIIENSVIEETISKHVVISLVELSVAETTETFNSSDQGYTNAQAIETFNGDNCKFTFGKGSNSSAPKYYDSGSAIRMYGGNTLEITSDNNINEIKFTFGSSDGSNEITANVGTFSTNTWTGSATTVIFTIGGTSGNRRIASISIKFISGESISEEFTNVNNFVIDYMKHDAYSINDDGNNNCLGTGGYYANAINALNDLTSNERILFKTQFELSYERLKAWASANGETLDINDAGEVNIKGLNSFSIYSHDNSIIIVILALTALSAFAFVYVAKHKQRKIEL